MTESEKRECLTWLAARRDRALAAGLTATAKSWNDMRWILASLDAADVILARSLDDIDENDAGTVP